MEVTQQPRTFTVVMSEAEARYVRFVTGDRTVSMDDEAGLDNDVGNDIFYALDNALDDE